MRLLNSFYISILSLVFIIIIRLTIPTYSQLMTFIGFYVALGLAYNIFLGFTNYVCFGYSVFIAAGLYGTALSFAWFGAKASNLLVLLLLSLGLSFFISLLIAGVTGAISLRLKEAYFAIATIGLSQGIRFFVEGSKIWGGAEGIVVSKYIIETFGYEGLSFISTDLGDAIIYATAIIAILTTLFLMNSKLNYALMAVREDEDAAMVYGVNPLKARITAFILSALLGSILGIGKLLKDQAVYPADAFSLTYTLEALAIVLIGGKGTLLGPLVAGILYGALKYFLTALLPGLQMLIMAPILIAIVELFPTGFIGWLRLKYRRLDKVIY
ncbi:branched-chain amino acid ABC transporter permease [Thermogladius sp. 4427co]|uniref:branched-chain amino acid ABC transporter permease n=1 Tax=Thermogladius sp. 4427co TaxID=3450718 RepID=UPI003F79AB14